MEDVSAFENIMDEWMFPSPLLEKCVLCSKIQVKNAMCSSSPF